MLGRPGDMFGASSESIDNFLSDEEKANVTAKLNTANLTAKSNATNATKAEDELGE